jgi:hypothetical protein
MRRPMVVAASMAMLWVSLALCQPYDDRDTPKGEAANLVPTPGLAYWAQPGEDAEIYDPNTPAGISLDAFRDCLKFRAANDTIGLEEYSKKKLGFTLALGTKLRVIRTHLRYVDMTSISADQYAKEVQAAVGAPPKPAEAVEVRVLDGEHKGKALFVSLGSVALMRSNADELVRKRRAEEVAAKDSAKRASKEAAKAKQATPEARAASLLNIASNLEKSGKTKAALENYRKVVKDFPDTPAAVEASDRIKALTT